MASFVLGPSSAFNSTVGAVFISISASSVLFAISVAQLIRFYRNSQKDGVLLKAWVAVVFGFDLLHVFLETHAIYTTIVILHSDPAAQNKPVWSSAINLIVANVVDLLVRSFYTYRIWQFSHGTIVPAFVIALSLCTTGSGIYFAVRMRQTASYANLKAYNWASYVGLVCEMVSDTIIAGYMVVLLRQRRTQEFESTNSVLDSLMTYTVGTCMLTVFWEALSLAMFNTMPDNFVYVAVYVILCQIYVNSMLESLNARKNLRKRHLHVANTVTVPSALVFRDVHELDTFAAQQSNTTGSAGFA